ncbi:MAG TPA: hypothetical protein VIU64_15825 [Polyangia bacterium]
MSAAAGAAGGAGAAGPGRAAGEVGRRRRAPAEPLFAFGAQDGWLVLGTVIYAAALIGALALAARGGGWGLFRLGAVAVLAVGAAWMSNTISHIHLHTPVFRGDPANRAFSIVLTVLLGIPQSLWKRRHLRHHGLAGADRAWRFGSDGVELGLLAVVWGSCALALPAAFFSTIAPVWLLGLGLCAVQGHYEHAGGRDEGVDHHGRLYNRLWFNDGYHVAHHLAPSTHWTVVPRVAAPATRRNGSAASAPSAWPPLLRWLGRRPGPSPRLAEPPGPESPSSGASRSSASSSRVSALVPALLDRLERATLSSRVVRGLLLRTHGPALEALVRELGSPPPRRVCIVGGGLFPRTAILLSRILPEAELVIVDGDPDHLEAARRVLRDELGWVRPVSFVAGICDGDGLVLPGDPTGQAGRFDLLVIPLALRGARDGFYRARPGCAVLVHDWMWRRRGDVGRMVSPFLLKRLNLVRDSPRTPRADRNLDNLSQVASVVEARCEPPCRTTALPKPTPPSPRGLASSTTRPWPASDEEIGRHS